MPNEPPKDLARLECDLGDAFKKVGLFGEQDNADLMILEFDDGDISITPGRIAEILIEKGWVKPVRCKDCINWLSPFEEAGLNGGHYCDIELQALGILYNCPPTHSCAYGEPKEGEE